MFKGFLLSLLAGFVVGLIVTDILQPYIFFSLFVGIPAAIATTIASLLAIYYSKRRKRIKHPR
jgi:Na+-driven multidrug efflux pump